MCATGHCFLQSVHLNNSDVPSITVTMVLDAVPSAVLIMGQFIANASVGKRIIRYLMYYYEFIDLVHVFASFITALNLDTFST